MVEHGFATKIKENKKMNFIICLNKTDKQNKKYSLKQNLNLKQIMMIICFEEKIIKIVRQIDIHRKAQNNKQPIVKMLRNFIIVTSLAGFPVLNEYAKTYITKTAVFKKTITQINHELTEINVNLSKNSQQNATIGTQINKQQEQLFDLILTPEVEKLLSTKSKNKVELIKKLRDQQTQNIKRNSLIMGVHSLGSFVHTPFFYWSAILYCSISQLSLLNDLITLKTGKKLVNIPFTTVGELYLKVSTVMLVIFSIKFGFKKLDNYVQTKQIVKRQP